MCTTTRLRADFHIHTKHSDGRGSMERLVDAAITKRLDAIAVTDHDVLDGARWAYALSRHQDRLAKLGVEPDIIVIPGIEVSSFVLRDGRRDVVHILLLGIDPFDTGLTSLCGRLCTKRTEQLRRRLEHARKMGYGLGPEAEGRVLERAFWGKQECARELVLRGEFEDVDSAYHALWDSYDTVSDLDAYIPADLAIDAGHVSGGIAVLAHPLRDELSRCLNPMVEAKERISLLQGIGVDGVECFYSAFSPSLCHTLEGIARERGLVVSCGSDHHDYGRRFRLSRTCADGLNYGHRTDVLEALGIASAR